MGNVSHLVTRTAAFQSSVENGLAEENSGKDRQFVTALARGLDILRAFHAGEGMLGTRRSPTAPACPSRRWPASPTR